jgi:hypothetical protein
MREQLRKGELCFELDDPRLREDLTAPRYTITGDKVITVESKDDIKSRIGRSTDAGDGVVYVCSDSLLNWKLARFRRLAGCQ